MSIPIGRIESMAWYATSTRGTRHSTSNRPIDFIFSRRIGSGFGSGSSVLSTCSPEISSLDRAKMGGAMGTSGVGTRAVASRAARAGSNERAIRDSNSGPSAPEARLEQNQAEPDSPMLPANRSLARLATLKAVLSAQRSQVSQPFQAQMWTNRVDRPGGRAMSLATARSCGRSRLAIGRVRKLDVLQRDWAWRIGKCRNAEVRFSHNDQGERHANNSPLCPSD